MSKDRTSACQVYKKTRLLYVSDPALPMVDDHDFAVQQSGCVICMEDNDPDELEPPLTSEEISLFGGVDGTSICMYSLLHSRFVAGTYAREVVAVHDVVPGPRVPRCWMHKENYDEWVPFLNDSLQDGYTRPCPGCNRRALLNYQNKVVVFGQEINQRVPCGSGRNLTPLYVAVEANRRALVERLLREPHLHVDTTSEVHGQERTPMRCAAELGNWEMVGMLLDGNARDDLWTTQALETELDSAAVAQMTGPELVSQWMEYIRVQDNTEPGIIVLAARAQQWSTVHKILAKIQIHFGDWNELTLLLHDSDGESVFVMAARCKQWKIVYAILLEWERFNTRQGRMEVFNAHCDLTLSQQKHLVKGVANVLLVADKLGVTALEYASASGVWNAVSILIACNACVDPRQCQATQELLLSAAEKQQWKVVKQILRFGSVVLRMQVRTIEQNAINQKLLWLACEHNGWRIVGRLVGAVGVHPGIPNADGMSPLWLAASHRAWDEMRVMLNVVKQADLQQIRELPPSYVHDTNLARTRLGVTFGKNSNGESLVTIAASQRKWDIVWRLLNEFYVDPATVDANGRSLLEIVITLHEWPLAAFLYGATWRDMPLDTDMSFLVTYAGAHHAWDLVAEMMKHGPLVRVDTANALYRASLMNAGVWCVIFWGLQRGVGKACDWMLGEAIEREQYWLLEFLYRHGARRPVVGRAYPLAVPLATQVPDNEMRIILQAINLA